MATIGGSLYTGFKVTLEKIMVNSHDGLTDAVQPLAESMVLFYIVIMGYNALKGNLGEWTKAAFISIFVIGFVYSFVFETNGYLSWLYEPLMDAIDKLMRVIIQVIGGTNTSDFNSSIDASFSSVFKNIKDVGDAADGWGLWTQLKAFTAVLILLLIFGITYLIYYGLLIVSMISLHIQLLMGMLIIFFAAFKGTRFIFFSWLKDMLTYALWPVYGAIVMSIMLSFFEGAVSNITLLDLSTGDVFTVNYGLVVLIGFISIWSLFKVPQFAASITGGVGGGAGGLVGGMIGGLAGGAAGGLAASKLMDKGKDSATGESYSRSGRALASAGNTIRNMASRGYNSVGRKMEGD